MDAVKILGTLLSKNALGSKAGGNTLDTLFGSESGGGGGASDILSTLLGGKKGTGGSGLAALAAIAAALAAAQSKKGGNTSGGGDLLGSLLGEVAGKGGLGGLRNLLGGSPAPTNSAPGSGLGDLVGSFLGGGKAEPAAGGLGDIVGSLLGGSGTASGGTPGLGSLLGSLLGGGESANAGIAAGGPVADVDPTETEESARILIEAMCHAAKCDGHVDAQEREAILGRAGDLDADEVAYLNDLLSSPTNLDSFVRRVPEEMAEQVYAFSLMAVKLDSRSEAEYFTKLAQGLGLDGSTANEIHASLGQPEIFA